MIKLTGVINIKTKMPYGNISLFIKPNVTEGKKLVETEKCNLSLYKYLSLNRIHCS